MSGKSTTVRTLLACLAAAMATLTSSYAGAASDHRALIFLGISRDGSSSSAIEDALQRRLQGLEFQINRVPNTTRCTTASCFAAVTHGDTTPMIAGRILANERACVATLWFYDPAAAADARLIEREVSCRPDWSDAELSTPIASAAGDLVEAARAAPAPAPVLAPVPALTPALAPTSDAVHSAASSPTPAHTITAVRATSAPSKKWAWRGSRKAAAIGTALLFAGAMATTLTLSVFDGRQRCGDATRCFREAAATDNRSGQLSTYDFHGSKIALGTLTALSGVGLITILTLP